MLAAGWALTLWLFPFSDERVNDLFVYRVFTVPVLDGALPYRDVFFEYPPLAAPAIALPGLIGSGEEAFRLAFARWTLALAAAVVLLCGALAARTGGDRRRALLAAALMPLLCGALVRTHFDLAPVALLLGALLLLIDGRPRWGMAVLGMAAMTKGFPIVVAPVALAWLAPRTDRRTLLQSAAALAAALAIPALVAVAFSPGGALNAVRYHTERPVQVESLPATAVNGLDSLGVGEARRLSSHRSDGLEHPATGALAGASLLLLLLVLGGLTRNQYIAGRESSHARRSRLGPGRPGRRARLRRPRQGALAPVHALARAAGRARLRVADARSGCGAWRCGAPDPARVSRRATWISSTARRFRWRWWRFAIWRCSSRSAWPSERYSSAGRSTCSIEVARPFESPSTTTALSHGSSAEVSKRT